MDFGTRQLSGYLRVVRVIVYCQAAIMVLTAIFAFGLMAMGGSAGFTLTGIVSHTTVSGGAVTTFAFVYLVVAVALVAVEREAARRGGGARLVLVAAEVALAVYLIGFVDAAPGGWIFGPVAGAAVFLLEYWPQLRSRSPMRGSATPAPAASELHGPAGHGPDAAAPPPL
jgi:hypothetical protein